MDDGPLPDHFKALGVERNADSAVIKKAHRLLVLKCHPDKVTETDPDLKQQKAEQFHKIQKAYEVLIDEKERATYEANLTLEALRKEKLARGGASSSREKSTRFDSRPSGNSSARYATEERKPSATYDDDEKYYDDRDRQRTSTRSKYDTYQAYPKSGSSPRTDKESSRSAKATTERHRSERTKARDKDDRRNHKFVSVDSDTSSADEKARYEADYKRRSQEDEARRRDADSRRKADDRRSYEDPRYDASPSARKMSSQAEDAIRYLHKSRAQVESEMRPPMPRTSSRDYYDSSRSSRKESSRPEAVRRSSARPSKDRPASSSARDRERDRGFPEIVEWDGDESSSRRMPSLSKHNSSPANIEIPRTMPQRSYTSAEASRDHRTSTSPPPAFHRSQTMPSVPHASSRSSKPATVSRPSGLRETMTPEQSHKDAFPSVPLPQPSSASKSTKYYYPTPNGGVPLRADDILAGGHRTVLREPGSSQRHRSPEAIPMSRPPIGPNRPSEANIPKTTMPPPPMGRSSSSPIREERGRSSRPLYGEVGRDSYTRPRPVRQGSYTPSGDVQYAPKYGPEDVRWAPRGRENDRDYPSSKPTLGRTATYVY